MDGGLARCRSSNENKPLLDVPRAFPKSSFTIPLPRADSTITSAFSRSHNTFAVPSVHRCSCMARQLAHFTAPLSVLSAVPFGGDAIVIGLYSSTKSSKSVPCAKPKGYAHNIVRM